MEQWITVIAALAGAFIGGLISYLATLVTIIRQERSEKRAIILEKLEELHLVARSIRQEYKEVYGELAGRLLAGLRSKENVSKGPLEIGRLAMLVGFYFPSLSLHVDHLELARNKFGEIIMKCITSDNKPSKEREALHEVLDQRYHAVDERCVQLLDAITKIARKKIKLN